MYGFLIAVSFVVGMFTYGIGLSILYPYFTAKYLSNLNIRINPDLRDSFISLLAPSILLSTAFYLYLLGYISSIIFLVLSLVSLFLMIVFSYSIYKNILGYSSGFEINFNKSMDIGLFSILFGIVNIIIVYSITVFINGFMGFLIAGLVNLLLLVIEGSFLTLLFSYEALKLVRQ